ncbi:MAG: hypothetical protein Q9205_000158 [Flavoplaca limonia]
MRHCLQIKHAGITSRSWNSPPSNLTQLCSLLNRKGAPIEGRRCDWETRLRRAFFRTATTVKFCNNSIDSAEVPEESRFSLSPLLDPNLLAARNRYKVPKPEPSSEASAFQKKLQKNPYAQALATPVRQCAITGARLPNFFLLDFGLIPHPRTGKPWQIPKLVVDENAVDRSVISTAGSAEENATSTSPAVEPMDPPKRTTRTSAGSNIVARQSAMKLISTLKRRSYMQLLPQRWKLDARFKADQIVWRRDMDVFVLELLRRKAAKLLKYLSLQPAAYIAPSSDYGSIQNRHQPGAVLWLGQPHCDDATMSSREDPPPYAMVEYRSSGYIPIYNLPALLGPEHLDELRKTRNVFNGPLAVIKQKRNTTDCQMQLWKLMGYMAKGN